MISTGQENFRLQKRVALLSLVLLALKLVAYYSTHSVAILTDALESIVNVAAAFIGLYSLHIAGKPRDRDHPYGHGKAEFISAAIEGTLIASAGLIILYKAIQHLFRPVSLFQLDLGIILIAVTAVINFIAGYFCLRTGKRNDSLALTASGKHLQSDSYSSFGIILGLFLIIFTGIAWIDSAVAIGFGCLILYTGYKIMRRSIAGIMDEADIKLLDKMVQLIESNRRENWVDLHNLRVIKYGNVLHVDCHLTVPWYLNIHEAHHEIDELAGIIRKEFGESLELFVHSDGCLPFSCRICNKEGCRVRVSPFEKRIHWTRENISQDQKHALP